MESLTAHILSLEQRLLDPHVRADADLAGAMLADDFTEVGRSGQTYTKAEMLAALAAEAPPQHAIEIRDFALRPIVEGVVLATYRTQRTGGISLRATRRSSLWRQDADGGWRLVFHQGTALERED